MNNKGILCELLHVMCLAHAFLIPSSFHIKTERSSYLRPWWGESSTFAWIGFRGDEILCRVNHAQCTHLGTPFPFATLIYCHPTNKLERGIENHLGSPASCVLRGALLSWSHVPFGRAPQGGPELLLQDLGGGRQGRVWGEKCCSKVVDRKANLTVATSPKAQDRLSLLKKLHSKNIWKINFWLHCAYKLYFQIIFCCLYNHSHCSIYIFFYLWNFWGSKVRMDYILLFLLKYCFKKLLVLG